MAFLIRQIHSRLLNPGVRARGVSGIVLYNIYNVFVLAGTLASSIRQLELDNQHLSCYPTNSVVEWSPITGVPVIEELV